MWAWQVWRLALPTPCRGVVNRNSAIQESAEQRRHGGGVFPLLGDDDGPLQILPEFAGDDLPAVEFRRGSPSDVDNRPLANESERGLPVRQGAAHDEVIVAVYEN